MLSIAGFDAPHGFSTRAAGSMRPTPAGRSARRAFLESLGLDSGRVAEFGPVHGAEVERVEEPGVAVGADGLVTDEPGLVLAIWVGDCHPVLLHDPEHAAIGIAHAGRRGTAAGITRETVAAMVREFGSSPGALVAGIGPGICARCYDVDVRAANLEQLAEAGVPAEQVHVLDLCTKEVPELFSHRGGDHGRFAAVIALP